MNKINERIKNSREAKGLSLEKVAKKMKIEQKLLEDWESGELEPDAKSANKLANILGVTGDYLLFGVDTASAMHTMFPSKGKPQPAGIESILTLISALLLFMGIGGFVMLVVMTGSRLVTSDMGFWEFFILSGSVYSAIAFIAIALAGAAVGLAAVVIIYKKKGKGKRK
ncbi:MAG: helix-turn-helix domain-containing protein [Clostridia bacterium]|nr:helix-turn-helix domain-containing protein [Clostridia bacterium]